MEGVQSIRLISDSWIIDSESWITLPNAFSLIARPIIASFSFSYVYNFFFVVSDFTYSSLPVADPVILLLLPAVLVPVQGASAEALLRQWL